MKKLLLIYLSLISMINLQLSSMQQTTTQLMQAESVQPERVVSVRFVGISDGIDVVIPKAAAHASKVLEAFLNFPSKSLPFEEKVWSLSKTIFGSKKFSSFDIKKMASYLDAIRHENSNIQEICYGELIEDNIRQLLIADYFNIEKLLEAEIGAITQKFNNPQDLLSIYRNNSHLSELMQSIPENMQEEIFKKLKTWAPFYMKYILVGCKNAKFSTNGKQIVTVSDNGNACIRDTKSGKLIHTLLGHTDAVCDAEFSPDDSRIVTASCDTTARIWNSFTGKLIQTLHGHNNTVLRATFSHNGSRIVTTPNNFDEHNGFGLFIWNASNGELMHILRVAPQEGDCFSSYAEFSYDDSHVLAVTSDRIPIMWNTETGQRIYKLASDSQHITFARFSPDGNYIATNNFDININIWNAHTDQLMQTIHNGFGRPPFAAHMLYRDDYLVDIVFSASSDKIVAIFSSGATRIYNLPNCELIHTFQESTAGHIWSVCFSPDDNSLITTQDSRTAFRTNEDILSNNGNTNFYGTARIWNTQTNKLIQTLKRNSQILSAEFSPDGNYISTRSSHGTQIWDNSIHLICTNNNRCALEQAFFIRLVASNEQQNQILDLNAPENQNLNAIFETFTVKQKRHIQKIGRIKKKSDNHSNSATASGI